MRFALTFVRVACSCMPLQGMLLLLLLLQMASCLAEYGPAKALNCSQFECGIHLQYHLRTALRKAWSGPQRRVQKPSTRRSVVQYALALLAYAL